MDIVLSPDNARVYVSHGRSEDVRVFEADTWKMIAAIPVGPRAWWMALTPDGRFLYVTIGRANEAAVIDTRSNSVTARITAGSFPWESPLPMCRERRDRQYRTSREFHFFFGASSAAALGSSGFKK